jgi:hypothetical protein
VQQPLPIAPAKQLSHEGVHLRHIKLRGQRRSREWRSTSSRNGSTKYINNCY